MTSELKAKGTTWSQCTSSYMEKRFWSSSVW